MFLRLTEENGHGRDESVLLWFALDQRADSAKTYIARKYRASSLGDDTREVMFFLGVVCWKSVVLWRGGGLLRHIFSCSDDI
jgi:hypothetical protein